MWTLSMFCCLHAHNALAQTHLFDPGFEEVQECPVGNLGPEQLVYWESSYSIRDPEPPVPWYYQSYHHSCDPAITRYWKPILGNGVIRIPYNFDTNTDEVLTALLWTRLSNPLDRDSLYYIEYTTAPTFFYYPPDEEFYNVWCISPNFGLAFTTQVGVDSLNGQSQIAPLYFAEGSGLRANESNTLSIGNCFKATGEEEYLLFGNFRHSRGPSDERCLGSAINSRFSTSSSLVDNFRLEKMELEICCDLEFCSADLVDFSSYTDTYVFPPGTSYSWNDGQEGLERSFAQSGSYQLTIDLPCGSISSNWINIKVRIDCSNSIYVPSAFSPNGDGLNDFFSPLLSTDFEIEIFQFSVFDRWGQQVYRYLNDSSGWDGNIRGKEAPIGVYTWLLEYQILLGDEYIQQSEAGAVSLIR